MLSFGFLTPAAALAQSNPVDTQPPSDVETLKAVPGDAFVSLEWSKAEDNVGVKGYKVYYGTKSVTNENTVKYDKNIDVGNVLQYIVGGLQNGETYYFAVTAYDAAGNESEYFSPETYAVPMSGLVGSLTSLPQDQGNTAVSGIKLEKAEAVDSITVKLTLNVPVQIPEKNLDSYFSIIDNNTLETLKITGVASGLVVKDGKENEVFLTTDVQVPETEYLVTLGNELKGKNGEAVVSGSGDTALFKGSAIEHVASSQESKPSAPSNEQSEKKETQQTPQNQNQNQESLELKSVISTDETTVKVIFNKKIVLSPDPKENFSIIEKDAPDKTLEIKEINLSDDKTSVILKTATPENKIYLLTVKNITDEAGNNISENADKMEYTPLIPDTTPPEDVTNFAIELVKNVIAKLTWTPSINSAKDLIDQILYKSLNKGESYTKLKSLGPDAVSYTVPNLVPGKEYYFKLTVKDKAGNESVGAVASIAVPKLPATGPAGIVILAIGSLGAGLIKKFRK